MALLAYLVALIIFVLATFGVDFEDFTNLQLVSLGLVFFVAGHILPGGDPRGLFNKS